MNTKTASLVLLLTLFGCNPQNSTNDYLEKTEEGIEIGAEQAKIYLDSIQNPIALDNRKFVRYTYLSCRVADSLETDLLRHGEIEKVANWYLNHDNHLTAVRMLLLLGRSSNYSKENYNAMNIYLKALAIAKDKQYFNEAGYILSYIGDLYTEKSDVFAAIKKYQEAAVFFDITGNIKSYAYTYRDIGRSWALVDSTELAMKAFSETENIALKDYGTSSVG